jgi:hypothetical protein
MKEDVVPVARAQSSEKCLPEDISAPWSYEPLLPEQLRWYWNKQPFSLKGPPIARKISMALALATFSCDLDPITFLLWPSCI